MNSVWKLVKSHVRKCIVLRNFCSSSVQIVATSGLCFVPLVHALDFSDRKKIEIPNQKDLSHEHLIQQAASVSVNAASQLLTQTVVAIVDISDAYRKSLLELLSLLEESQNNIVEVANISDSIIASRAKVNEFKKKLMDLESFLEYVEKLVLSTAETSFIIGAEFVSSTLTERLYTIKFQLEEKRKEIAEIENECLILQKNIILDSNK